MPKRIKDFANTATTPAVDDYVPLDGTTSGTRKILASALGSVASTDITDASSAGRNMLTAADAAAQVALLAPYIPVPAKHSDISFFQHTLSAGDWRKAAKFTSTHGSAIQAQVRSSTGYCKILNFDGTYEAVDGAGVPDDSIAVASKTPTSPFNTLIPKFYAVLPCSAGGTVMGELTHLFISYNQLTSFDGTGLSSLTHLDLLYNQLTSFDGTGLSSLTLLGLGNNQLTSFDGTGLSSLTHLDLPYNQLTSFDGTGLSSLVKLNISANQLTSITNHPPLIGSATEWFANMLDLGGNALSSAQIDACLNALYATPPTSDALTGISVNGGTNGAPTSASAAIRATYVAASWVVLTN